MTDLYQFSDSSRGSSLDSSSKAGFTSRIVLVEPALLELSKELAQVAELLEELALELFYDTVTTVLGPALLTVPLRGLNRSQLYFKADRIYKAQSGT